MNLLMVEMRRALHRRLVRVLVVLALVAIVIAGFVEFFASVGLDVVALQAKDGHDPAVMTDWWIAGSGDGVLSVSAFLLLMGGLIGGASVVGAEWRAGTISTVLTWEPRRLRLHAARVGSAGLLAAVIALALQVVFLLAFLPSVLAHGTTVGADGEWALSLAGALARVSLLTATAAVLGCAIATLGRNTAAAIVVAWGWLAIGEGLVRGLLPEYSQWLVGENATVVLTWAGLDSRDATSFSPVTAGAVLAVYTVSFAVLSAALFQRRDVAGT
ncbi:MAG: hypothetical protein WD271_04330 [Acidimicrobiia bacterium]